MIQLCLFTEGCLVSGKNGNYKATDGMTSSVADKIQTSTEHPDSRRSYIPTDEELKCAQLGRDRYLKRLERNYFLQMTAFQKGNSLRQKSEEDCWAACTQMLLKHERIQFSTEELERLRGKLYNASKANNELSIFLNFLNSYKPVSYCRPVTNGIIIDSIGNNHPVLLGFDEGNSIGHIRLAIGFSYSYIKTGILDTLDGRKINLALDEIIVIEPATGEVVYMPADEVKEKAVFATSYGEYQSGGFSLIHFETGKK
jgi:hypothetical protein